MAPDAYTVGVDIGTTSVKALAVDGKGTVVARTRVPHQIGTPAANRIEHDPAKAWRSGPRRAFASVTKGLEGSVAGVAVSSMVPSITAVGKRGVPLLPGLLYTDARAAGQDLGGMPDAVGFLRWAVEEAPEATGYWPCQATGVAALGGKATLDTAAAIVFGDLHDHTGWRADRLEAMGVRVDQMPRVINMAEPAGTLRGTDTVYAGGTIDALCDQLVCGAADVGDVFVIFGATLVTWIVTKDWIEIPGLVTVPHTVPDRILIGGPSNAGALFVDWARGLLAKDGTGGRDGDAARVPIWLPYLRGERVPFNDATLRSSVRGLDITHDAAALRRASFEASGFVIRRMIERSGISARRIVASGGGTKVEEWMEGVADATGLPVDTVAVPEGAAYGAAFLARVAAGLESSLDESQKWAGKGRRVNPDPVWSAAADARYKQFEGWGTGS